MTLEEARDALAGFINKRAAMLEHAQGESKRLRVTYQEASGATGVSVAMIGRIMTYYTRALAQAITPGAEPSVTISRARCYGLQAIDICAKEGT